MNAWDDPKYATPEMLRTSLEHVEHLMRRRYPKWQKYPQGSRAGTMEHFLRCWASSVSQLFVEVNPKISCDEYEHILAKRIVLDEFLQIANDEEKSDLLAWVVPLVKEIDETFQLNTTPDPDGYVAARDRERPEYWFLRRLPNHALILKMYQVIGPNRRPSSSDE